MRDLDLVRYRLKHDSGNARSWKSPILGMFEIDREAVKSAATDREHPVRTNGMDLVAREASRMFKRASTILRVGISNSGE
jgi:hypothetical protein